MMVMDGYSACDYGHVLDDFVIETQSAVADVFTAIGMAAEVYI